MKSAAGSFMARLNAYLLLLLLSIASVFFAFRSATERDVSAQVALGKYLVEEVARCGECHTPRDAAGNRRREVCLQGAAIWIRPVAPIANWADQTPPLAGLPSLTDEQAERVLGEGVGPEEETLRPPMHT